MTDQKSDELEDLGDRIAKARGKQLPEPAKKEHHTMANMAWRMVIELVAGISIGFGIGYGLDWLFGTMPIFLILFRFGFGSWGAYNDADGAGSPENEHGASH